MANNQGIPDHIASRRGMEEQDALLDSIATAVSRLRDKRLGAAFLTELQEVNDRLWELAE